MVRVSAGARLHFGFCNLSLSHERLYGALGITLAEPRVSVEAAPSGAITVEVADDAVDGAAGGSMDALVADVRTYAERATSLLEVEGAALTVESALPRHTGLGSGTQVALTTLAAISHAHARDPEVRRRAPALGRGGRSGVGVAAFEGGGFILDAGHPTTRFTTERPADGSWSVPAVAVRHPIPDGWRFLIVRPDAKPGRNGAIEDAAMRDAVERASPELADRISGIVTRRVLPAVAEGRAETFGAAVAEIGRLNGAWYADEQGGVYRPPVGDVVAALESSPAVFGAGQSSWGPTVYGVTDVDHADAAREAGAAALSAAGVDGEVTVVGGANEGARVQDPDRKTRVPSNNTKR
ncbi:beta-ribofuranosylaminobenzene 5'-phosphate synthase family protein [Halorubrum vacuolatum]|uniref:Beta-ribofuranosylaminobenzene 5'-phosphate synthase n=1 Tax=Halorubrum vacuolatum TaxID=63740 RepID=A0A238XPC8_HALVU|nr:beta-ribofuranosylaminobenzene 5'-phosphate synthase family protein [Halorubrum vacuolatum]SNR60184.1 beta-ribofuranosylaminobenzene 5'-phosphate synthase [Halorubrum vacuolatum]